MADGHLYLFERCKSYKDRKISINEFNGVTRALKLPEQVVERVSVDNQGRVLYDDFVAVYNSYFDDNDSYRPGVRSSSRYLYGKQAQQVPLRESTDVGSKKERKEPNDQLYARGHHTDDRLKKTSTRGYHDDQYSSLRLSSKKKSHPRSVIESHKSEGSYCSDDEPPMPYTSTSPMTSLQRGANQCKHCIVQDRRVEELEEDLQAVRKERKRLENSMHSIRNDFQSYYKKASELQAENDRLRARLGNKYGNEYGGECSVTDMQHEKTRRQLEDKLSYSEGMIMQLQKENHKFQEDIARLKSERTRLQNKNRDIEKELWHVQNEVQDISIRLLQEQKSRSAVPSEKSAGRAHDNICFNNIGTLRSTFHGKSRYDDEMDVRRKGLPIQRISSAGAELSGADSSQLEQHPVRDDAGRHSGRRARSHKSVKSEDSDGLALHLASMEIHEENSTVFNVLGHEVSKGALPDTISEEVRNAMVKSLENCHSVQEVIRLMVSYGCSPMSEKLQGIQVENERLQKKLDRIKSEHRTLQLSFQEAKEMEETLYARCQQLECNEGYLQRSLYYCQRALDANELLVEMKSLPSEHGSSNRGGYPSHFPTFDTGSISETSSRSPDHSGRRHSLIMKARTLLQALDTDQHLQELYLCHSQDPASSSLSTTWQPELSQNTTSGVSGISSLSSIDGDLNSEEVERLKTYGRIMKSFSNKMDNVVMLDTIAARPKSHVAPDTYRCDSSSPIIELEKATHAEELATIREEKAELRSRIYMMEQNQRRLELELSQKDLQNRALNKAIGHLQYQMVEEKRRRKRDKLRVKKEGGVVSYEGHVTDLTSELQEHMEREKELVKQYEDLYGFLSDHVAKAKDNHDQLLEFIKDLKRANNALVEAYEKSKLHQKMERRQMQQEYNRAIVLGQPIDQSADAPTGLRQNQVRL